MDIAAVRALYDEEQRIHNQDTGVWVVKTEKTVRMIAGEVQRGAIIYSQLDANNADAVIDAEIAYFANETNVESVEWKVFDYDQPADLLERVKAHGFVAEDPDAICVLDLANLPDRLKQPITHDIRRITDPVGLADIFVVQAEVWADPEIGEGWLRKALEINLRDSPETLSVYVAYIDGKPASSAWMDVHEGRSFAGMWGGSTLEEHRGKGLYTELIAVRAQEAIRRGIKYLTIDASPMSRPIVEKHGFQFMAYAYECNYAFER